MSDLEARLFVLITDSRECEQLRLTVAPAPRYGIQILHREKVMGIWSERSGRLGYRNLASWHVRQWADTAEAALEATLAMARDDRWLG